jgi:hypothetical protein
MAQPPSSQTAPLPQNLPFRIISGTIGSGAYALFVLILPLIVYELSPVIIAFERQLL